ncbi:L,D-transpeptidase family protein [Bradyrhizobium sp. G127]|uniref:L,D-transpeptidase family protein n=1 Tax=Bradyrhizobium sp. G127 TaxID=2904800 RepID=UPI001F002ED6|nr:L,D-transpeptidase family protein [Bradyrhizobium sp. G127]MCF2522080.1 L,D-transpeptidase family protein [Bradyrhizobium sp. G127]
MRDFSTGHRKGPTGFDRVLMAVTATFLSLAATSAIAQSTAKSPADLAIDAAIPLPEPANVPPPTVNDFKPDAAKPDTAAAVTPAPAKKDEAAAPATTATVPPAATATAPAATTPPAAAAAEPPKTEPAKAAPAVAAADQPVADKLRDLIATKGARYFDRKNERTAVENFYKDRNYAPLWSDAGAVTARAKSVIARLKDAGSEGLNPTDYPIPDFSASAGPDAQAEAELRLTESLLDYARHAQSGRMHWSRVSADISYPEHPVDPVEVLVNISTAKDASAALDSYNPPHKGYQALKAKLAALRGVTEDTSKQIAEGDALKFVKPTKKNPNPAVAEDPRVPALRAKLNITEHADDTHYDAKVADAVRKFQANNDLKATGILDNATVRALNGPKSDRQIDIVRANMERWRWLPRELGAKALGDAYVILNIPDYTLKLMHNGKQAWTTRVVVGKPGKHATPELTETMKFITVNPTWNVPPSIIYNEYLPALQQDPTVLDRMGLKLARAADGSVRISQPPGEANALGRIRFNFPNKFLVYQHDTPDKHLFAKEERAFSHGCMRVQNPDQYAANLLSIALPKEGYTPEKIKSLYGRSELNINFPTPIPVNITYQTAFVDDAGKLEFRKDIYGRDARIIAMLKGSEGKDMETVVSHAQPNYVRPTNVNIPGDSYASNGPSFFERLFGAPTPPPAAVRGQRRVIR